MGETPRGGVGAGECDCANLRGGWGRGGEGEWNRNGRCVREREREIVCLCARERR